MRVVCVTCWFARHPARPRLRRRLVQRLRRLGPCVRVAPAAWLLLTGLSFSALNDELSEAVEQLADDPGRVPHRLVLFPVGEGQGWAMGFSGADRRGEAIAAWL